LTISSSKKWTDERAGLERRPEFSGEVRIGKTRVNYDAIFSRLVGAGGSGQALWVSVKHRVDQLEMPD